MECKEPSGGIQGTDAAMRKQTAKFLSASHPEVHESPWDNHDEVHLLLTA